MKIVVTILSILLLNGCKSNNNTCFDLDSKYEIIGEWEGYYIENILDGEKMVAKKNYCKVKIDSSYITISKFIDIGMVKGDYFFEEKNSFVIDTKEYVLHSEIFYYNTNQILIQIKEGVYYPFYLTRCKVIYQND